MKPVDLIRYITWHATQEGIRLSTNRLVKFLYLADLYYARFKSGQTITGFPWRFVYYGPYCTEAWNCIEEASKTGYVCKETFESTFAEDKEYSLFSCNDPDTEKLEEQIHIGILSKLQSAIKRFGDDTPLLLDHVYFDTEPMEGVKKGDLLDFSKAKMPEPLKTIQLRKIPEEKIKLAREKIKLIGKKLNKDRDKLIKDERNVEQYKDESYYRFIKLLDGEELEVGLKGTAKIKLPR
ncbi:MAG: hypothetical protein JRF50_06370 [Deltaproteobacteria bacterium]|nr:hypothetical protein [Deltaproteobacteria bacterium]